METGNATNTNFIDYVQIFEHLFAVSRMLCGQRNGVADRLSEEVAQATRGLAQLLLRRHGSTEKEHTSSSARFVSFPVQFGDHIYGTIEVASAPGLATAASLVLPLPVAHLLAQTCSWLLYTFELAAFYHEPSQPPDFHAYHSLTKRERDVFTLICRRYDQETIAKTLNITPETVKKHRQRIYAQFGVHSEQALLLAAYQAGLFSPIDISS